MGGSVDRRDELGRSALENLRVVPRARKSRAPAGQE